MCPELESTAFGDGEWFTPKSIEEGVGKVPSGMMRMKASFGIRVLIICL